MLSSKEVLLRHLQANSPVSLTRTISGSAAILALSFLSGVSLREASALSSSPPHPFLTKASTSAIRPSSNTMSTTSFTVAQFPSRSDNYGYLLHDPSTGATAAIDTPNGNDYERVLNEHGWILTHIFNTHHHHDHTGGNLQLKHNGVTITGPIHEQHKIPGIDYTVGHDDDIVFGNIRGKVIDVGGHTKGHIAYYFPEHSKAFVGDSLFSLGCGRMFEGTPEQFWSSLQRLRSLPDDTMIYCAHEYTSSNAKFAMSVEPNNPDLQARVAIVHQKRSRGEPTVPTVLGEEKKTNPFLRVDFSREIQQSIGVSPSDSPAQAFGKLRRAKDNF